MKQTLSSNPPLVVERVSPPDISSCSARFLTSRLANAIAFLIVVGALAVASPSYAQRGGGGSSASSVGGHSGGGGSFGGGGGGHPASAGGGSSGGGSHSGGGSRNSGASTSTGKANSVAHGSGFSTVVRRFLGLPSTPKARMTESSRVAGGVSPSTSFMGHRTAPSGVPAALARVHLTGTPSAFGESRSSSVPAISAPPRPIPPHPRHPYYPPGYGCYACGFDFGFGFGLPLFYFGYWDWSPPFSHGSTQSPASMLLYTQDGSAFEVTDYWVDGDILDYVTVDGKQGNFAVATLDLQRTIDANARVGLKFTLDRTQRGKPFENVPQQSDPANQPQPPQDPGRVEIEKQKSD
jgi:hypothetical protein